MTGKKKPLGINVYHAATARIEWVFRTFSRVCVSFSGGKDSTVLLHMVAEVARKHNREISILFIDWEVQVQLTIEQVIKNEGIVSGCHRYLFWVAIPLKTVNGVSQIQPEWVS